MGIRITCLISVGVKNAIEALVSCKLALHINLIFVIALHARRLNWCCQRPAHVCGRHLQRGRPQIFYLAKDQQGPLVRKLARWVLERCQGTIINLGLMQILQLGSFSAQGKNQPTSSGKSLMCAYKLCKVEFRYWGMQSKIEKFIHDVGEFARFLPNFELTSLNDCRNWKQNKIIYK